MASINAECAAVVPRTIAVCAHVCMLCMHGCVLVPYQCKMPATGVRGQGWVWRRRMGARAREEAVEQAKKLRVCAWLPSGMHPGGVHGSGNAVVAAWIVHVALSPLGKGSPEHPFCCIRMACRHWDIGKRRPCCCICMACRRWGKPPCCCTRMACVRRMAPSSLGSNMNACIVGRWAGHEGRPALQPVDGTWLFPV